MFVMMSKYVMRTKGSSLLQKVRHDINKTSSRQTVCHDVKNIPNVCHEIKNTSWCQKVCHDVKRFVMVKGSSLLKKNRHYFKNTSWCQKIYHTKKTFNHVTKLFMTSQSSSLQQKHTMTSKVCHEVKKFVMSWHPIVCYNSKYVFIMYFVPDIIKKNVKTTKSWSWRQKYVITTTRSS